MSQESRESGVGSWKSEDKRQKQVAVKAEAKKG